jgi:predicted Zn-dependent protease
MTTKINVYLMENEEINAVALPGGNIVVFTGLVAQVESENELAMVLAHEMGHFTHRIIYAGWDADLVLPLS